MSAYEPQTTIVRAPDGRDLEVVAAGPADGVPLVVHHGTPGAAALFPRAVAAGAERGLRHVGYSRPGYAGSSRRPGRSVADCAEDVSAVADALGLDRFHTIGGSGGGPHVLACARLLPDRVISAAAIASGAPYGAAGLDWLAGMGSENVEEFTAALAGEQELERYLEPEAEAMAALTGEDVVAGLGDQISDPDRDALSGAFGEHIARQLGRALSAGPGGWLDDDLAFVSDWGFELGRLDVPVSIWHGRQDRFVPVAHGEWLAAHISDAKVHIEDEHAHLSLTVTSYGTILDELIEAP